MGMESDVKVAVEGNLKDYEMSMFTRQAMPRPDNLTNNSTLKQLELNALQLKQNQLVGGGERWIAVPFSPPSNLVILFSNMSF